MEAKIVKATHDNMLKRIYLSLDVEPEVSMWRENMLPIGWLVGCSVAN